MTKEEMNVLKEVCFEYGVKVRARLEEKNYGTQTVRLRLGSCIENKQHKQVFDLILSLALRSDLFLPRELADSFMDDERFGFASRMYLAGLTQKPNVEND